MSLGKIAAALFITAAVTDGYDRNVVPTNCDEITSQIASLQNDRRLKLAIIAQATSPLGLILATERRASIQELKTAAQDNNCSK